MTIRSAGSPNTVIPNTSTAPDAGAAGPSVSSTPPPTSSAELKQLLKQVLNSELAEHLSAGEKQLLQKYAKKSGSGLFQTPSTSTGSSNPTTSASFWSPALLGGGVPVTPRNGTEPGGDNTGSPLPDSSSPSSGLSGASPAPRGTPETGAPATGGVAGPGGTQPTEAVSGATNAPASSDPSEVGFAEWWKKIVGFEGSIEDWEKNPANKHDRGGLTNFGITFQTFKAYAGAAGLPKTEEGFRAMTPGQAKKIGKAIWKTSGADKIKNPGVALIVGDWFWGSNVAGIKRIKDTLRNMGHTPGEGQLLDAKTIDVINSIPPKVLIQKLSDAKAQHRKDIVKNDPSQEVFLNGWLRRTEERRAQAEKFANDPFTPTNPGVALQSGYQNALSSGNYAEAAKLLNGFNAADIQQRLAGLSLEQKAKLHEAAVNTPGVGGNSQVAKMTHFSSISSKYAAATANNDWATAARYLNGMSASDIQSRLGQLSASQREQLHNAAVNTPGLGPQSAVALSTQ